MEGIFVGYKKSKPLGQPPWMCSVEENINLGLIKVFKHFLWVIIVGLIFRGSFGQQMTCVYQNIHHSVSNQRDY